jgi:hypothetical protein
MEQPETASRPKPNIAGTIAMLIVGLLIFIPSGLCTGFLGGTALINMLLVPFSSNGLGALAMALTIGGPFVLGGGALIWFGVKRLRGR